MIDEKKIEEAARKYAVYPFNDGLGRERIDAFKAGINWFLGNLWHDGKEEPKEDACILIYSKSDGDYYTASNREGIITSREVHYGDTFEFDKKDITRWLYIDDLLKGGNND